MGETVQMYGIICKKRLFTSEKVEKREKALHFSRKAKVVVVLRAAVNHEIASVASKQDIIH